MQSTNLSFVADLPSCVINNHDRIGRSRPEKSHRFDINFVRIELSAPEAGINVLLGENERSLLTS